MKYWDTVRIIKEWFYYWVLWHIIYKSSYLAESMGRELFPEELPIVYTVQSSLGIINVWFKEEDLDLIKK